ncbi:MAG TPA: isoprenylcysteine carboxylmethyltransferase family protein [Pyrinomonadaceae bacterium]
MEKVRRFAIIYFVLQGAAVFAWWIMLVARPDTRDLFRLQAGTDTSLFAFLPPDIAFIAAGSLITALLLWKESRYEIAAMWLVTGSISYAAIYTSAFTAITDRGWLGVALMLPAMLWTGTFATGITIGRNMFRPAKVTSSRYVLLKTYIQIVVIWSIILIVFPYLITILEDKLGIARIEFPFQKPIAVLIFSAVSLIGIWAAHSMSRVGRGTPLPLDHAKELVVVGPYAYVRNPMAVSGILQGLAVALFLGSPLVAIYALMGSAIWQSIFRPLEEDDLVSRFGGSYENYRSAIRCWVPNRTRYQTDDTAASSNSIDVPLGRM